MLRNVENLVQYIRVSSPKNGMNLVETRSESLKLPVTDLSNCKNCLGHKFIVRRIVENAFVLISSLVFRVSAQG